MIPSIRTRIDQENGGVGNHDQRMNIPAEEMAELREFRKLEYFRQAREIHNSRLVEMEQAEARDNHGQDELNEERPYGLPHGRAIEDIWEQILDRVYNAEDVINLRNTCQLFRGLLQRKYKTIRLIETLLDFPSTVDGIPSFFSLREVCRYWKQSVEQRILETEPPFISYFGDFTINGSPHQINIWPSAIPKPNLRLGGFPPGDPLFIPSIVWDLEHQTFSSETFPILRIHVMEETFEEIHLPTTRVFVLRILELVGSRVRWFRLNTHRDGLDTYNHLRSCVALMPNIEHLAVSICLFKDPPPALPVQPFPACPKLKRFKNEGLGLSFYYVADVFFANPWISEVVLLDHDPEAMVMLGEEVTTNFQEALATTQMEWFCLSGPLSISGQQFLECRFQWPLKYLALTISESDETIPDPIPSITLIRFVNSFGTTLEELHVNWKLRDNGGYLDLPKVRKLVWKLWPEFKSMEFIVALDGLQYLDVLVGGLTGIGENLENAKAFINNMNLPSLFPALREIRTNFGRLRLYAFGWHEVWRA